jgi:hypothetical protein
VVWALWLSDADEIIAVKLRDEGIATAVANLKDLLKAGGPEVLTLVH